MFPRTGSTLDRVRDRSSLRRAGLAGSPAIQVGQRGQASTAGPLHHSVTRVGAHHRDTPIAVLQKSTTTRELDHARRQGARDVSPRWTVSEIHLQHGVRVQRVEQVDRRLHVTTRPHGTPETADRFSVIHAAVQDTRLFGSIISTDAVAPAPPASGRPSSGVTWALVAT